MDQRPLAQSDIELAHASALLDRLFLASVSEGLDAARVQLFTILEAGIDDRILQRIGSDLDEMVESSTQALIVGADAVQSEISRERQRIADILGAPRSTSTAGGSSGHQAPLTPRTPLERGADKAHGMVAGAGAATDKLVDQGQRNASRFVKWATEKVQPATLAKLDRLADAGKKFEERFGKIGEMLSESVEDLESSPLEGDVVENLRAALFVLGATFEYAGGTITFGAFCMRRVCLLLFTWLGGLDRSEPQETTHRDGG